MRESTFAGLTVRLTGGPDRQGRGDGPLVVLMHGFGAPGTDLLGLWRVLDVPGEVRFAFPEAPNQIPGMPGARAWWMLDMNRAQEAMMSGPKNYATETPPGMDEATDQIVKMLGALQDELGTSESSLVLGGFSQGSMAACNAVFARGISAAGLVILSGTPVSLDRWEQGIAALAAADAPPRVFQSHGQQDPLLSFDAAHQLHSTMTRHGLDAEWVPFRGGHEIPMPVLAGLGAFLSQFA